MLQRYKGKKHYEIHIDDTILCLNRLTRNKDTYTSIFDEPILKEYKRIHDLYGTVFTLGLFYRIDTNTAFNISLVGSDWANQIGWTLNNTTDKFKAEWAANARWLKFNFHSYSYDIRYNEASGLVRNAGTDYAQVKAEVYRFAGEQSWHQKYNKLHWYSADAAHTQQIRDQGVNIMMCNAMHAFNYMPYHLSTAQRWQMYKNGTYYDDAMDCLFVVGAGVVERVFAAAPDGVGVSMGMYEYLNKFSAGQPGWSQSCNYLSFETHEDWFIGSPTGVVPQYAEAARWCYEKGYTPAFITEDLCMGWNDPTFNSVYTPKFLDTAITPKWVNPNFV